MTARKAISVEVLVLSVFTITCLSSFSATAETCELGLGSAQVRVETYEGKMRINNGHSSNQLAAKIGGHGASSRSSGWVTRGLTKTSLESQIEVGVQLRKIGKNRYCIGLQKVTAQVGYKEFRVYVARDLKPGSCEYRTTMGHEQAHVAIYKDQLRQFAPRFEQRLLRAASRLRPIISKSTKAGPKYFLQKLNSEFRQVFKQLNRETDSRQGRLDTPQNYRREQALCPARSKNKVR